MESVDKLRAYCDSLEGAAIDDNHVSAEYVAKRTAINVRRYADEIVQELEKRYMELPVDADGVPIHVGDLMKRNGERFTVCAVASAVIHTWANCRQLGEGMTTVNYVPGHCTHFKPRTVEDVLRDFQQDTLTSQGEYSGEVIDADEWKRQLERDVREYADELRELMEVDE